MLKLSVKQLSDWVYTRDDRRKHFYVGSPHLDASPSKILRRKYFRVLKQLYSENRLTSEYFPYVMVPARTTDTYAKIFTWDTGERYYVI